MRTQTRVRTDIIQKHNSSSRAVFSWVTKNYYFEVIRKARVGRPTWNRVCRKDRQAASNGLIVYPQSRKSVFLLSFVSRVTYQRQASFGVKLTLLPTRGGELRRYFSRIRLYRSHRWGYLLLSVRRGKIVQYGTWYPLLDGARSTHATNMCVGE